MPDLSECPPWRWAPEGERWCTRSWRTAASHGVIEIRGLRLLGAHGTLPEEMGRPQPFEVDIDVHADIGGAAASGELASSIDYAEILEAARAVVEGPHVALLEQLAEQISASLLRMPKVAGVEVCVRKLRPPVPFDVTSAGVRVSRRRPSGTNEVVRAFLALGSNVGDRWAYLRRAVEGLPDLFAISAVYETEPVGGPPGQEPYLNLVAELRTSLSPNELLVAARRAEAEAGRVRAERWGPRTLDVDVLLYGDEQVATEELQVPHPRMWERGFVLVPLADLAPELVAGKLTSELRQGVRPAGALVLPPSA